MLDHFLIRQRFEIRRNRRHRDTFEIAFHILMRKYHSTGWINKEFDLGLVVVGGFTAITGLEISQYKLPGYANGFDRNIQEVAKYKVKDAITQLVTPFRFQHFMDQELVDIGIGNFTAF